MIYALPTILSLQPFKQVGFYAFRSLKQCVLKAMSSNLILSSSLPEELPTRSLLIGRFHHRLMHLASQCSSSAQLGKAIEDEIAELQRRVDDEIHARRYGSVSGWPEVNRAARAALKWFASGGASRANGAPTSESMLHSKSTLIVGTPDYYAISSDSSELFEFKSSSLFDETGRVKAEYAEQLIFYAALLYENFTTSRIVAKLQSLAGELVETSITSDEAFRYLRETDEFISRMNESIEAAKKPADLAFSSSDACLYCQKKVICDVYQANQHVLRLEGARYVVRGQLESISDDRVGFSNCKIQDSQLDVCRDVQLPSSVASQFHIGDKLTISGLSKRGTNFVSESGTRVYR